MSKKSIVLTTKENTGAGAVELSEEDLGEVQGGRAPGILQQAGSEPTTSAKHKSSKGDNPILEFTGAEPKNIS